MSADAEQPSVSLIIPAYNEADRIAATVRAARTIGGVSEIIVIDDGSRDATTANAKEAGADKVITLRKNRGKAAALNAGLAASEAQIILMLDGDLESTAEKASALLSPVVSDACDMTIAVFPELVSGSKGKSGGFGIAMKAARIGLKSLTGREFLAPLSGQRALKRDIVESMGGFGRGFGVETKLTGWAAMRGWRIEEVPIDMKHRRTSKDMAGYLHRFRQLRHILAALVWLKLNAKRQADV